MGSSSPRSPLVELLESRTLLTATVSGTPTIVNASKLTGPQQDETIVYNPTNPNQMYLVADNGGTSLLTSSSSDGGHTWTPQARFTGSDGFPSADNNPTAAYDSFGNLYVAYTRADTQSTEVLYSYDNGQTFHVLASLTGIQDFPILAAGPGVIWLGVTQNKETGNPASVANAGAVVYAAKVTGLGRIAKLNRVTSLTTINSIIEGMSVGPAGQLSVAYEYLTAIGPSILYTRTDPDGLGTKPFGPVNSQITTEIGTDTVIPAMSIAGITAGATLAYDDSPDAYTGRLYMAYVDASSTATDNTNIFLRYSDDGGTTWSGPIQVNDDTSGNSHFNPTIAVDPITGTVALTWYDSRNDNGIPGTGGTDNTANDDVQVYGAVGTPTASSVSFSPNFIVQPAFSNANTEANIAETGGFGDVLQFGIHNGLTFYGGHAVTVWADNSNSTGDNADGTLTFFDVYAGSFSVTTTSAPIGGTLDGSFGSGSTFIMTAAGGARVSFHLTSGEGYVFTDSSGNVSLHLSGTTTASVLSITAVGGSRRFDLDNAASSGPLGSINAPAVDLTGTFSVNGPVGRVVMGNVTGGTFAAYGNIGKMTVASLTNATVLSGASPGADDVFSGAGDTDNSFAAGSIASLVVNGAITSSFIGAGVNPVDGIFGNGNDTIIGGSASRIGALRAVSADSASHFEAGAFGMVRLPETINPATDSRFLVG